MLHKIYFSSEVCVLEKSMENVLRDYFIIMFLKMKDFVVIN